MKRPIYLDHHATTPVDARVLARMLPYFSEIFGNPASRNHSFGWEAAAAVSEARLVVAGALGAAPEEIIFTSGATEAVNLAILGAAAAQPRKTHIVATAVEHKAVLDTLAFLAARGFRVDLIAVDAFGRVDPLQVAEALTDETLLVAIILANNEIGTLNSVGEVTEVCRARGVPVLTDASQAVGRIPVNVNDLGVNLLALSGHKVYGPKGIGALYVRGGRDGVLPLEPLIHGGGHEQGLRSGTLNVPGIVGLAAALEIATDEIPEEMARLTRLRDRLEQGLLSELDESRVNGRTSSGNDRLPGNLNMSFAHVEAEAVLMGLTDIALSTGSACTSSRVQPSHVLKAIGLSDALVHGSIRFGLGRGTTEDEIEYTIRRVSAEVKRLRQLSPTWAVAHRPPATTGGFQEASGFHS